jgi:predicted nucleotidyltransferase component of viral defense system
VISKQSLNIDWLKKVSINNGKADPLLVEKVIRALLLLEGLVKAEAKFVFKGGTALMLLMGSTKRLSIDIDIIVSTPQELESLFKTFLEEQDFNSFELSERSTATNIKKAHYKFFYTPVYKYNKTEDYILLDILFEEPHYAKIISWQIDSTFTQQEGKPMNVSVPSYEDILGDKLTAFAPNTTGIPYYKGKDLRAMEIMKQLYDIGSLLDAAEDVAIVAKTFRIFANTEIGYRECDTDANGSLDDIYDTALHICSRGTDGKGDFKALSQGILSVKNFIFSERYHIERAIVDASKAAYIATVIKHDLGKFEKYIGFEKIKDFIIDQSFNQKLNKLKKSSPEAFHYWYQISIIKGV